VFSQFKVEKAKPNSGCFAEGAISLTFWVAVPFEGTPSVGAAKAAHACFSGCDGWSQRLNSMLKNSVGRKKATTRAEAQVHFQRLTRP